MDKPKASFWENFLYAAIVQTGIYGKPYVFMLAYDAASYMQDRIKLSHVGIFSAKTDHEAFLYSYKKQFLTENMNKSSSV